jgi:hypothetical protein
MDWQVQMNESTKCPSQNFTPSLFNGLAKFKQMRAQNVRHTTSPSIVKELASSKE